MITELWFPQRNTKQVQFSYECTNAHVCVCVYIYMIEMYTYRQPIESQIEII